MKRQLYVLLLCSIGSLSSVASIRGDTLHEFRIWNSNDGKSAEARFIDFKDEQTARLEDRSGKQYLLNIQRLSAADRAVIRPDNFLTKHVAQQLVVAQPNSIVFDKVDVRKAFSEMSMEAGFVEEQRVRTSTQYRTVSEIQCQRQCVCVNGRWVWRTVPKQIQRQVATTVNVPMTVRVAVGLIDGANWTIDSRTGFGQSNVDLQLNPGSVGARAKQVNKTSTTKLPQLAFVNDKAVSNDTLATMGSTNWWPNPTNGTEQIYRVVATINPVTFSTIDIRVLLRARDSTKVRLNNKTQLNGEAQLLATAIKNALEK